MKKLFAVSALCAVMTGLQAQQKSPADAKIDPASNEDNRIVLDVNRVNMLFTVSDKKGRFITDLTRDDFEVFQGKKPQNIIEFIAESDLPLRLAVVIDTSNSIRERFKIDVGDVIQFTVLGQPIDATVTSVRHINWRDSRAGGFIFVFRPGVLEDAPVDSHGLYNQCCGTCAPIIPTTSSAARAK